MRTDQKLFCLKSSLVVFIVFLWLFGAILFGVPLWLLLDYWSNEYLLVDQELQRYLIILYVLIVVGAIILIFGIVGLIGALTTNKGVLIVFVVMISFVSVMTAGGFVFGFIYREDLKDTIGRGEIITHYIREKYTGERDRPTQIIDLMQSELNCCGGEHFTDYTQSNWMSLASNSDNPDNSESPRKDQTPLSCCNDYERYQNAQGTNYNCYMYKGPVTEGSKNEVNPKIHRTGCKHALVDFFDNYIGVVVGIAVTLLTLQLICVIIGSILIHILRNLFVPQPDDIVYDMARKQEKSPYPSRGGYSGGTYYN
ncbi:hypothetical protein LOTGIDRAFT_235163 [Lottia gigantea]|uniref:Tetraspanin n=1 Tax=Lottia gigantea TaxID=225164 RepID=V4A107_LOTGI|nr:hypothetical protein LOTGIDRAFT_235163 [Lottia gigantea]ESO86966.1 hypothetical protein LOTGIDRAFT_235163 [Lottia gigantea]